jgi:hypothetical protein
MQKFAIPMLALAVAAMLGAETASAQVRPFTIGISGGPTIPSGDLADEAGTGYHVQGSVGVPAPLLPGTFRLDLLWQELPDEHVGNFRQLGALLNVLFALPTVGAQPYLLGGIGVISTREPDVEHADHTHAAETHTDFGINAGVGVSFPLAGMSGVIEARVLNLLIDTDHRTIPISFGIRF